MRTAEALTVVVVLFHAASSNLPEPGVCGFDASDRIYGGNITNIDSYPWTALLIFRRAGHDADLFHCGGSLISDLYVLTAAHCIDGLKKSYTLERVRLGEWDLLSEKDCNTDESICNEPPIDVGIDSMIKHEGYDKRTLINDVALIKLNRSIEFTDTIQPVCLPFTAVSQTKNTDDMIFNAVGWGNTEHKNGTYEYGNRYKLHVNMKGVNLTFCDEVYDEDIIETQLCAGAEKGRDTCQGDSGGGLVAAVDGYYYEYGIVSWGYGCGQKGIPGVYTRVTSFEDWIKTNMN